MAGPDRREWLGVSAAGMLATGALSAGQRKAGPIVTENDRPGSPDWQLTYARFDATAKFRSSLIEGYASRTSVRAGKFIISQGGQLQIAPDIGNR